MRKLGISNRAVLVSAYKKEISRVGEFRFLHRLHCVLLIAQGFSCYQVADWFGEHPSTLERWVHYFHQHGLEGLKNEQKTGRPGKVRDDQRKKLQTDLSYSPVKYGYYQRAWSGKLLKSHLEEYYDVQLSIRQCQRLLRQLLHDNASQCALTQQSMLHTFVAKKQ